MRTTLIGTLLILLYGISSACRLGDQTGLTPWEKYQILGGWGQPENLGPNINDSLPNCRPSISPSGDTLYFECEWEEGLGGMDIWISVYEDTAWSKPINLGPPINTPYPDGKPFISIDGRFLYFDSSRPGGYGLVDIYVSTWTDSGWSEPELLPFPINTGSLDGCPSISADGKRLYFMSQREGGYGNRDLWVAIKGESGWDTVYNLGPTINTSGIDWFAVESPDGNKLFIIQDRPGGWGNTDLWVSYKENGEWTRPVNCGLPINDYINCAPSLTPDGKVIYFGGGHLGEGYGDLDIWRSTWQDPKSDGGRDFIPAVFNTCGWTLTGELEGAEVVFSLLEASDGTIYAGVYPYGRVFKTKNGGESWDTTATLEGATMVYCLIEAEDGSILAGTFPEGAIFRTEDGGESWTKIKLPNATEVRCFLKASDNTLYAGTAPYGDVFKSVDNGLTWTKTGELEDAQVIISLFESEDGTLFAGSFTIYKHGLYRSMDEGEHWEHIGDFGDDVTTPYVSAMLQIGDTLLAGVLSKGHGAGKFLYRSIDGGLTWSNEEINTPHPIFDVWDLIAPGDGAIWVAIGTRKDSVPVFRSTDGGRHWTGVGKLPTAREAFSFLKSSDNYLYVGTAPNGDVYKIELTGVEESKRLETMEKVTLSLYPTIVKNGAHIEFSLPEPAYVTLQIFDASGRLLRTLLDGKVEEGKVSVIWDGKDSQGLGVGSGVYFCLLKVNGDIAKRKKLIFIGEGGS
jgi:photosystem II stability/assembly factor-like uncharacterized protein